MMSTSSERMSRNCVGVRLHGVRRNVRRVARLLLVTAGHPSVTKAHR